jgi:adenylate kinase
MRLIILGGPGAGKSTQAERLCIELGITRISTGDILLEAIAQDTALGRQVQSYVEQGKLAPDEIMIEFIRQRLQQSDVSSGWLLDGYPRTAFQAEELDFLLDDLTQKLNWAIWLNVPEAVLVERSLMRSRVDDQIEAVQRRIRALHEQTIPMLDYYDRRQRLLRVNGEQTPEQVQAEIQQAIA